MTRFLKFISVIFLFSTLSGQTLSFSQQPVATLNGKITDENDKPLPGANVHITGTKYGVSSNESGDYFFNQIPRGKIEIQVSFVGFRTRNVDYEVYPGENSLNILLETDVLSLEAISVTAQRREQQIIDVPITMSVITSQFLEDNYLFEIDRLSEFVPGFQVRMQGINRPSLVLRGLSSDEVSPAAQPRISVF